METFRASLQHNLEIYIGIKKSYTSYVNERPNKKYIHTLVKNITM